MTAPFESKNDLEGWDLFRNGRFIWRFVAASGWTDKLIAEMVEGLNRSEGVGN